MAMIIGWGLLATLLAASAVMKLSHRRAVVESYTRAGVPEDKLNALAVLLLVGATGLVAEIFVRPIGLAAGVGVVVYFLAAIIAHVRARDTRRLASPLALEVLPIAALVLRAMTLETPRDNQQPSMKSPTRMCSSRSRARMYTRRVMVNASRGPTDAWYATLIG